MQGISESIAGAAREICKNYEEEELFRPKPGKKMPERAVIIEFIRELKKIMFPGYFGKESSGADMEWERTGAGAGCEKTGSEINQLL